MSTISCTPTIYIPKTNFHLRRSRRHWKPRRSGRISRSPNWFNPCNITIQSREIKKSRKTCANRAPKTSHHTVKGSEGDQTHFSLGVVDPLANISGSIVSFSRGSGNKKTYRLYDVTLSLVDIEKNHDKYIVLQIIRTPDTIVFYERWGRTGTAGQSLTRNYSEERLSEAIDFFEKKFLSKTGNTFHALDSFPVDGKYRVVKLGTDNGVYRHLNPCANWQYWVDDWVDGKPCGWYDYDQGASRVAEKLYSEYNSNEWLAQRVVQSGNFSYLVDLQSMTQTNVLHPNRTTRRIRRNAPSEL